MVTDQQVRRLMGFMKKEKSKAIAASKAGMSRKTAAKYAQLQKLPSEMKKPHTWRTRPNPFCGIWDEVKDMVGINPGLEGKTIFEYLQRKYSNRFQDGQLRTLQRHLKIWRAKEGPAKEVFFPQEHHPGELSQSDVTHMTSLKITILGEPFKHLLYHFVLTYSNWETGSICFSESFEAVSSGYQEAVWELGGVAKRHRTDRMTAAVNKACNPEKFNARYKALLGHYGVEPERTNVARANENGDIEQRHYRFKKAVDQALILRGSRDFSSVDEYKQFIHNLFNRLNAGRKKRVTEEMALLRPLPARKLNDYKPLEVSVGPSSTIRVRHNTYSVHSRLIGETVYAKPYVDYIDVWYAQKLVERIPRLKGEGNHRIQYRHIIDWLVRKPGAFENYRYKSDMFPSSYFRMAYDYLKQHNPLRANKEYVNILYLASRDGENIVELAIRDVLSREKVLSSESIKQLVNEKNSIPATTDVTIDAVTLERYDELLMCGSKAGIYG